jgi:REP element-mobilizing transposase RayT
MKSTDRTSKLAGASKTLRLEAAVTGRQDACPTRKPDRLAVGFHSRDHLPHLKKEGGSYFVTFRLAGTLPAIVLQEFKLERERILQHALAAKRPLTWHEQEELFRRYSRRVDAWLDAGHGDCFLRQPEIAKLVADALTFFDGRRYELRAWVVMPNHVHAVVRPYAPETLSHLLHTWKSFSSKEANKVLGRSGGFWQSESYDHLIRDDDDHARCVAYTVNNPVSARLCGRPEGWPWSSAYRSTQGKHPV